MLTNSISWHLRVLKLQEKDNVLTNIQPVLTLYYHKVCQYIAGELCLSLHCGRKLKTKVFICVQTENSQVMVELSL